MFEEGLAVAAASQAVEGSKFKLDPHDPLFLANSRVDGGRNVPDLLQADNEKDRSGSKHGNNSEGSENEEEDDDRYIMI